MKNWQRKREGTVRKIRNPILLGTPLAVLLIACPAHAHIVPAEEFLPPVESYRRLLFTLNLNPVPWELVRADTAMIAGEVGAVDEEMGEQVRKRTENLAVAMHAGQTEAPSSEERRKATEEIFCATTEAMAFLLTDSLERTEASLENYRNATAALKRARQLWASFEHEVKHSDQDSFGRLGRAWLEMASAVGRPGLFDSAGRAADVAAFTESAEAVKEYVEDNYGKDYMPLNAGRLSPLPWASPTFEDSATVPVKLPPGSEANKQLPRPRQILNMAERGVDESETVLIALGDMGFDSPFIFGDPAQSLRISCNTCHNKSITNPKFFVPGLSSRPGGMDVSNGFFAPHANNGHFDALDIPDLRGIRFTAPYGRNGRFDSLREFVRNVIVNEFNGPEPDPVLMDGIIAYMLEFDFLSNPKLEPDGSLSEDASPAAKRGEAIFHRTFPQMGGRSCATCHIPSTNFVDHKRHDIGTFAGSGEYSRDRVLDTPTLLGIKYTAPYFHDGSQPDIRSVNSWFNEHYGLGLSEREIGDLTAYVETVGDGIDAYEDTVHTLESELQEFSFFLSAYEYLKRIGKFELIGVTFQTIAQEIHAHKWDLQDQSYMQVLNRMAGLMEEALAANREMKRDRVDQIVAEYRALFEDYAEHLN